MQYNANPSNKPLGLLPAWRLYTPSAYKLLVDHYGRDRVYILSAGWGLIRSDFLTPNYDITFSSGMNVEKFKRRRPHQKFDDFCMLPEGTTDPILFLGGKSYVPLFCKLTSQVKGERTVFYAGDRRPHAPGCTLKQFRKKSFTNWHYLCAKELVQGGLGVPTA